MKLETSINLFPVDKIITKGREREDYGDIEGLASSIKRLGLLHPIIIDREGNLKAGGRRLRAFQHLGEKYIPARFYDELTLLESRAIELEENTRRKDFDWREEVNAYADFHWLCQLQDNEWTIDKTAELLDCSTRHVYRRIMIAKDIKNPAIQSCKTLSEAYNVLSRRQTHSMDNVVRDLIDNHRFDNQQNGEPEPTVTVTDEQPKPEVPKVQIFQADFFEWAKSYKGPPFHFLHMDPPYGVGHNESDQGGSHKFTTYEDTEEIYFKFLQTVFENSDRLLSSKSHIMLWFSMQNYAETLRRLAYELRHMDVRLNFMPLIWFKEDGSGIVPDHMRGPRQVYETALMLSLGDRKTFMVVNNLFSYPLNRNRRHISEKPWLMLMHFFRMFIDSTTRVLDPCCGAGTSVIAAAELKPESVTAFDLEQSNVDLAISSFEVNVAGGACALSSLDTEE